MPMLRMSRGRVRGGALPPRLFVAYLRTLAGGADFAQRFKVAGETRTALVELHLLAQQSVQHLFRNELLRHLKAASEPPAW